MHETTWTTDKIIVAVIAALILLGFIVGTAIGASDPCVGSVADGTRVCSDANMNNYYDH